MVFSTSDSSDVLLLSKVRNLLIFGSGVPSLSLAVTDLPIQSDSGADAGADTKSCDLSEPIRQIT